VRWGYEWEGFVRKKEGEEKEIHCITTSPDSLHAGGNERSEEEDE
jgi:hypothetical protein